MNSLNMDALTALAPFVLAYLIGALPLGSRLVEGMTGRRARDLMAHNVGVENLLRFVGAPLALGSFFVDVVKGALALALTAGSPWAALGIYAGHLYPPPLFGWEPPRGRGNGVLLGVLAGLWAYGGVPFWVTVLPMLVYAALLARYAFVAPATLAGLVALPLLLLVSGQGGTLTLAAGLIFLIALWRHKVSLARILDGTEPRLGEPPPVRGVDPGVVYAAFMIHPMTLEDLWQAGSFRWLELLLNRGLPEPLLRRVMRAMRPQKQGEVRGVTLSDGRELRVMLIGGSMLPDQIRAYPEDATRMAIQGARLARELGAEAFGLGAFWSTVGNKGLEIQKAVPDLHITNGGAYTAGTVKAAVPGLLARFAAEGGTLRNACAAVVGANGVVAFGVARTIAPEVGEVILVGRDKARLERSARTLARKFPATTFHTATDVSACSAADLIFTATSDPNPVLFARHVKPGAWIFDLGRPADVDESVKGVPGVSLIPGGVVRPPGAMRSSIDIHFGDGLVPACMAETMIMTATRAFDRKSLGPQTSAENVAFYLLEGERLGFDIITRDERVAPLKEFA